MTFPIMKSGNLENLPIVIGDKKNVDQIVNLVEFILTSYQNKKNNVVNFESVIDNIVYRLYNLTYKEVLIIDPKFDNIMNQEEYYNYEVE